MKLLLDQNLSRKLVPELLQAYPGSSHVFLLRLQKAADSDIWFYARHHGDTLVTKNTDMVDLCVLRGAPPKVLWLWWAGPYGYEPDLDLVWRAYVRRFDLEHTVRFCKQTLGWTIPRPRHPEQADRWTWLIMAGYTQLRLARQVAGDQRLPWERPRPRPRLSPVRVRRGFPQLLVRLGSPASAPKPAGCPPGRPKGRCSGPARRYPAIKKPIRRPHKKTTKAAKTA